MNKYKSLDHQIIYYHDNPQMNAAIVKTEDLTHYFKFKYTQHLLTFNLRFSQVLHKDIYIYSKNKKSAFKALLKLLNTWNCVEMNLFKEKYAKQYDPNRIICSQFSIEDRPLYNLERNHNI